MFLIAQMSIPQSWQRFLASAAIFLSSHLLSQPLAATPQLPDADFPGQNSGALGDNNKDGHFNTASTVTLAQHLGSDRATVITAGEVSASEVTTVRNETALATGDTLTPESIRSRRDELDKRTDLDEATKSQSLKSLDRAIDFLTQTVEINQKAIKVKSEREDAPRIIAELKAELSQTSSAIERNISPEMAITELERCRLEDLVKLDEAKKNLEQWESRAKLRAERRPQMPTLIDGMRKQLEEANRAAEIAGPEGENTVLTTARQTELRAHVFFLQAQLELYRNEQLRYEALNEAFPLQRDSLTRQCNALTRLAERWNECLAKARLRESELHREEAWCQLENAHPDLRNIAERNAQLTQKRQTHLSTLTRWKDKLATVNETRKSLSKKLSDIQSKVDRVGQTTAIGLSLRQQQSQLPALGTYRKLKALAEQEFEVLQLEQLQLEDERKGLDDIESRTEQIVRSIPQSDLSDEELRNSIRELLVMQRGYLESLQADYDSCLSSLVEIEYSCRQTIQVISNFEAYINERILWIRSAPPVDSHLIARTVSAIKGLSGVDNWNWIGPFVMTDFAQHWPHYLWLLMLLAFVQFVGWRTRRLAKRWRKQAHAALQSGVSQSLRAVSLSIVAASFWPILFGFASWRTAGSGNPFGEAWADGLKLSAILFWMLSLLSWLCRRDGVAEIFWQWSNSATRILRRNLRLYMAGGVPLVSVIVASHKLDSDNAAETIGRISFVAFCMLVSIIIYRVLQPRGAVVCTLLSSSSTSLAIRLRWLWFPLAVLAPIAMAGLALSGYQYTSQQLMFRLELTLGLMIILSMCYAILKHWMFAARRRLALKQAKDRRAAELASNQSHENAGSSVPSTCEVPQLDLSLINQQALRLVQGTMSIVFLAGIWAIWNQVLPAIQVFGRVELWSTVVSTTEMVTSPQGPVAQEITRLEPVTRSDLLVALVAIALTWLATKNLPALLELSVLPRLPLDHGSRNAIKILTGYAIMVTGAIIASNTIGLQWSNVQWLVAALTVGLGFGLQEIFANFVSGLIILFERPVRVGDIVTIDGVSGVVSRIRIRATTITDWDHKEFIVPNREFVTGRLLNWTLSDKTTRVTINVGVGYDSDVTHALATLKEIAHSHTMVLQEPPPSATFEGFGDSTLNLILRVFLANIEHRIQVITDLHLSIHQRFREENIEISFPQRDLHIRSVTADVLPIASAVRQAGQRTRHSSAPIQIAEVDENTSDAA